MRRLSQLLVFGIFAVLLAGCLPIELSVHDGNVVIPRGEGYFVTDLATGKTRKLYDPGSDMQPVAAVFSPDGKQVLTISEGGGGGGMMGKGFTLRLVDAATGNASPLGSSGNVTYAAWSPTGQQISLTRLAGDKHPPLDENMPELVIFDAGSGESKVLANNVSVLHRWLPVAKRILSFQIEEKIEQTNHYRGHLVLVDAATGKMQKLLHVVGSNDVFFDLSPDGKKALFTAFAVGAVGQKVEAEQNAESKLFELNLATQAAKPVRDKIVYAIYSPDGKHTLLGAKGKNNTATLEVAGPSAAAGKVIAEDTLTSAGAGFGPSTKIYATWVDADTVIYLAQKAVYGTEGKNLHLIRINTDGSGRADLQADIDNAAIVQ